MFHLHTAQRPLSLADRPVHPVSFAPLAAMHTTAGNWLSNLTAYQHNVLLSVPHVVVWWVIRTIGLGHRDLARFNQFISLYEILLDGPIMFGQATLNESVPSLGHQQNQVVTCHLSLFHK